MKETVNYLSSKFQSHIIRMWHEILFSSSAMMLFLSLPEAILPRWNEWWHGNVSVLNFIIYKIFEIEFV